MSGICNFIACVFSLRLLKEAASIMTSFTDAVEQKLEYFVTGMLDFS